MPGQEAQQDAFGLKVAAWVAKTRDVNPIVAKAAQDGCLSQGTHNGQSWPRPAGIPVVCTTAPVILIVPYPPVRNVKYHVPEKAPRWRRDSVGKPMFEGGEHTAIGDSAFLYFSATPTPAHPRMRLSLSCRTG